MKTCTTSCRKPSERIPISAWWSSLLQDPDVSRLVFGCAVRAFLTVWFNHVPGDKMGDNHTNVNQTLRGKAPSQSLRPPSHPSNHKRKPWAKTAVCFFLQFPVNIGDFTGPTRKQQNEERIITGPTQKQQNEERIIRELRQVTEHLEEEKMADDMKEEWHYTMRVFDRLFFVIFFLLCVGFITCIFLISWQKGICYVSKWYCTGYDVLNGLYNF